MPSVEVYIFTVETASLEKLIGGYSKEFNSQHIPVMEFFLGFEFCLNEQQSF